MHIQGKQKILFFEKKLKFSLKNKSIRYFEVTKFENLKVGDKIYIKEHILYESEAKIEKIIGYKIKVKVNSIAGDKGEMDVYWPNDFIYLKN